MAAVTAVRRSAQTKPQPKPDEKKEQVKKSPIQRRANSTIPAYMQRRLALGTPGDAYEVEAEKVADHVGSGGLVGRTAPAIQRSPAPEEKPKSTVQRQPNSATPKREDPKAPGGKVQRKEVDASTKYDDAKMKDLAATQKAGGAARGVQRKADANSPLADLRETKEHRKEDKRELLRSRPTISRSIQRQSTDSDGGTLDHAVENSIEQSRGSGTTLPTDVREGMEQQIGHDFSGVHLHHDAEAASLASEMHAQAFTVGHDIYFGQSQYQPHSDSGQHLLAHELTHVVQQSGGGEGVQRATKANAQGAPAKRKTAEERIQPEIPKKHAPKSKADTQKKLEALLNLEVPLVKRRHLAMYQQLALTDKLSRKGSYYRDSPDQREGVWKKVDLDESKIRKNLPAGIVLPTSNGRVTFKNPLTQKDEDLSKSEFMEWMLLPKWNRLGQEPRGPYEVDHIVELQVSGEDGKFDSVANQLENMELLDRVSNGRSGNFIKTRIEDKSKEYVNSFDPPMKFEDLKTKHTIYFEKVTVVNAEPPEDNTSWWTLDEVKAGVPAAKMKGATPAPDEGTPTMFVLLSGPGGIPVGMVERKNNQLKFPALGTSATCFSGLTILELNLTDPCTKKRSKPEEVGTLKGAWALPDGWQPAGGAAEIQIKLLSAKDKVYAGYLDNLKGLGMTMRSMSPVVFPELSIGSSGPTGEGRLDPSFPLFRGIPIVVRMRGKDITFSYDFSPSNIKSPFPGLTIDDALISVFYSTQRGFGIGGNLDFSVGEIGDGSLSAAVSTTGGIELDGSFSFDTAFFDRAKVHVWYRNQAFGAEGVVGIDKPGKIRGVKRAELTVGVSADEWSFKGSAEPSIPGIQQASILAKKTKAGLVFEGDLTLAPTVAIKSGSMHATVAQKDEGWKVAAKGTAQPNVPGIESSIDVNYDDGTFTAELNASYHKNRLDGTLLVGVTNSPLGEDGKPTGQPPPDGPSELRVYGGGNLTLVITPWLQGTAGVRILPNGEIEVRGRLAVPQPLTIFDAKRWDRTLVSIGLDIPIFGMAVAGQRVGIFCTIGGDLKLVAGIGPAQLCNVALDVLYNPSHADKTTVTGTAAFYLPADAGLRLAVHAAIGAGIPIVSAQAGIELGAMLGLQASINAPLTITWSPSQGLDINQNIEAKLQPKFKFDVKGYLLVEANLFLTTVELYRKDWDLAKFELGSDYDLGLSMPFHYQEGKPFNPSMDDLKLTYPKVDPMELVRGLFEKIT